MITKSNDEYDNDHTVSPLVRGMSVSALILTGMKVPSLWKNLDKNFPGGLSDLIFRNSPKRMAPSFLVAHAIAKATLANSNDSSVAGNIANKERDESVERHRNLDAEFHVGETELANIELQRLHYKEQVESRYKNFHNTTSKQSIFDRQKNISDMLIEHQGQKGFNFTDPKILKKEVVLDLISRMTQHELTTYVTELSSFNPRDIATLTPDAFSAVYDRLVKEGAPIGKHVASSFIKLATVKNEEGVLARTSKGFGIRLGMLQKDFLRPTKEHAVNFDVDDMVFPKKKKRAPEERWKEFQLGKVNPIEDTITTIEQMFPHMKNKEYGNFFAATRAHLKGMWDIVSKVSEEGRKSKKFGWRVDPVSNSIIFFGMHDDGFNHIKTATASLPLPMRDGTIRLSKDNMAILTSDVVQHGKAFGIANSYHYSAWEIANFYKPIVHGTMIEPREGEQSSIQRGLRSVLQTNQTILNPITDHFKSKVIRTRVNILRAKGSRRAARFSGIQQHTLMQAAAKDGRDFIVYDQEFVAGREGPNIVGQNPHTANPYQLSYTKISSTGEVIGTGNFWIKDPKLIKAADAWKRGDLHDVDYMDVLESLDKIGKAKDIEVILSEVSSKKAVDYHTAAMQLSKVSKGSVVLDYAGRGGSDQAIMLHQLGFNPFAKSDMIDVYEIQKAAGSFKYGYAQTEVFADIVRNSNDSMFNKYETIMLSRSESFAHKALIHDYRQRLLKDPHNKREALVELTLAYAHDSSVDAAMTTATARSQISLKPILGTAGSSIAKMQKMFTHTNFDLETQIHLSNTSNLASHFFGDRSGNVDIDLANISPTDRSSAMMKNYVSPGVSASILNFFERMNSGLKQTHQLWQGLRMKNYNPKDGTYRDPIVSAFRLHMEHNADHAVADNIAMMSEPVNINAYLVQKGSGDFSDGGIIAQKHPIELINKRQVLKPHTVLLGKDGEIMDSSVKDFLMRIRGKYTGTDAFKGSGTELKIHNINTLNELIQKECGQDHSDIARDLENGIIDSGESSNKYFNIRSGDMVAQSKYKRISLRLHKGKARISDLVFSGDSEKGLSYMVQCEQLLPFAKLKTPGKALINANVDHIETAIGTDHTPMDEAHRSVQRKLKPIMAIPYKMFEREELGTDKQIQLRRVYAHLMADPRKGPQAATNFLQSFGIGNVTVDPDGAPRIVTKFRTIEEEMNAFYNMDAGKMEQGMVDAGLIWDSHSIALARRYYGIKKGTQEEEARDFDNVIGKIWEKRNPHDNFKALGGNYKNAIDTARDNYEFQHFRGLINPYYDNINKKIVDPLKTSHARQFDPREVIDPYEGRRSVQMGILTTVPAESMASEHFQEPAGVKAKWTRMGTWQDKVMEDVSAVYRGSFFQSLIQRTQGKMKHQAVGGAMKYLGLITGQKNLGDVHTFEMDDPLGVITRRTITHREIIRKMNSKEGFDLKALTVDGYKQIYKESVGKYTAKVWADEAERLRDPINLRKSVNPEADVEKARELEKMAKEWYTKPVEGYNVLPSEKEIRSLTGTLFEGLTQRRYSKGIPTTVLKSGEHKIAANDYIILKSLSKPSNMEEELWADVKAHRRKLGLHNEQSEAQLEMVEAIEEKFLHRSGMPETMVVPTMQAIADLNNLSIETLNQDIGWKGTVEHHITALMANNEMNNKCAADVMTRRGQTAIKKMNVNIVERLLGKTDKKKGLLYTESNYWVQSIYGEMGSYSASMMGLRENLALHSQGALHATAEEVHLAKKMYSGMYGMIDKQSFNQLKIGDISVKDWLASRTSKKEMEDIMAGRKSMAMIFSRDPIQQNMHKWFSSETYIYDSKSPMFQKMMRGLVMSGRDMLESKADNDSDKISASILDIKNVQEFGKFSKETRIAAARENQMIYDFHLMSFANHGDYKKAGEQLKKKYRGTNLHGFDVNDSELGYITEKATELLDGAGLRMERDPLISKASTSENGYSLRSLTDMQNARLERFNIIDASKTGIGKHISRISFESYVQQQVMRGRVQNIAAKGIGVVSNYAQKMNIRQQAVIEHLSSLVNAKADSKGTTELVEGFKNLGLFPNIQNMDPSKVFDQAKDILNQYKDRMSTALSNITKAFVEPIQALTSGKKQIGMDADEIFLGALKNLEHIHTDKMSKYREGMGIELSSDQISAMKEFKGIHNVLFAKNLRYRLSVSESLNQTSKGGSGIAGLKLMLGQQGIAEGLDNATPAELSALSEKLGMETGSKFAEKTATAWRNSVKPTLYSNKGKTAMGMGVALSLIAFTNPNALTGGMSDLGMDLGHRPGFNSSNGVGIESLDPEPGQDVFSKKWTYLLKNDPILKDNMSKYTDKRYSDINMNTKKYNQFNAVKKYKRNYINQRATYEKRYETNDMRRIMVGS